jgi:hypothetical protein
LKNLTCTTSNCPFRSSGIVEGDRTSSVSKERFEGRNSFGGKAEGEMSKPVTFDPDGAHFAASTIHVLVSV